MMNENMKNMEDIKDAENVQNVHDAPCVQDVQNMQEMLILYALGELEDGEREAVEAEIQKNPEFQAHVERYRRTDTRIQTAFREAPPLEKITAQKPKRRWFRFSPVEWAAVGLICAALWGLMIPATQQAREAARFMQFKCCDMDASYVCEEARCISDSCEESQQYTFEPQEALNSPDGFRRWEENTFQSPKKAPFSTFGVDVDTASYTLMRSYVTHYGQLPPPESVRVEEYINYFDYNLSEPTKDDPCPFRTSVEVGKHPWIPGLLLAKVGLQGRRVPFAELPPLNLVFLIDVSGSMSDENKLPLVKKSLETFLEKMRPQDRAAIVTYCGAAQVQLEPTDGTQKNVISRAIQNLTANGSTNGSGGVELAYELASRNFQREAINRVILCSDGDFNIGKTSIPEMKSQIESSAKTGVFLTVLGFGMGNFQDDMMEVLADSGNGSYAYIDSSEEAQRILAEEASGTFLTLAKDVKIQLDFNPATVAQYRLIGYENRKMRPEDFRDDRKDAGEIGAGHSVTALYEIVPVGIKNPYENAEPGAAEVSRYAAGAGTGTETETAAESGKTVVNHDAKTGSDELFYVKLRWKQPDSETADESEFPVKTPSETELSDVSPDFRLSAGTALFAEILRKSRYVQNADFHTVLEIMKNVPRNDDKYTEFRTILSKCSEMQ